MPINIYNSKTEKKLDWICDEIWDLATQIPELKNWIIENKDKLKGDSFVADIGFTVRKNAVGGGAVIESDFMKALGEIGMDIYLSEYLPD